MSFFWVTFLGGKQPGCVEADTAEEAGVVGVELNPAGVRSVASIPYKGFPVLRSTSRSDGFEPRCSDPVRCSGKMFCQKQPSCSE